MPIKLGKAATALFGCRHSRLTWPLSVLAGKRVPAYRACLECGAEIPWEMDAAATEAGREEPRPCPMP